MVRRHPTGLFDFEPDSDNLQLPVPATFLQASTVPRYDLLVIDSDKSLVLNDSVSYIDLSFAELSEWCS